MTAKEFLKEHTENIDIAPNIVATLIYIGDAEQYAILFAIEQLNEIKKGTDADFSYNLVNKKISELENKFRINQ